jgi:hypothetical protein
MLAAICATWSRRRGRDGPRWSPASALSSRASLTLPPASATPPPRWRTLPSHELSAAGQLCATQIIAELGEYRARYLTPDQRAADTGLAPVTRQSGRATASASAGPATDAWRPR